MADELQEDLDINTDEGFARSLARKTGREEQLDANPVADTPDVQRGLTQGDQPERGADGRFQKAQPEGDDPGDADQPRGDVDEPADEPAADEPQEDDAQKLIGRQGQELGELRKLAQEQAERIARLEGRAEATPQSEPEAVRLDVPLTDEVSEQLESMFTERGVDATLEQVLSNPTLRPYFEEALEVAADFSVPAAVNWSLEYQTWKRGEAQPQEPAEPAEPPAWQQRLELEEQSKAVVAEGQALAGDQWASIADAWPEALNGAPEEVKALLRSEDQSVRAGGLVAINALAAARVQGGAVDAAKADKAAADKRAASVGTGSQRSVAPPPREPDSELDSEERIARFKEMFRATETTSVADGLREGSK